jgi:hypothetical protein
MTPSFSRLRNCWTSIFCDTFGIARGEPHHGLTERMGQDHHLPASLEYTDGVFQGGSLRRRVFGADLDGDRRVD